MALHALHARTHPALDVPGCYGCRAASVAIGFHRCPEGKEEWHGDTIKQRQEKLIADAARQGSVVEPVHTRADSWAPVRV